MISADMWRRAQELTAEGVPFVSATVVRVERPSSVETGSVALVLGDGTIEGFVGGVCTEHSVRAQALEAIRTGRSCTLRIRPFDESGPEDEGAETTPGTVTVQNPCLSGGSVELFLEPVLPARRVLVVGSTPIADALVRIGAELDFDMTRVDGDDLATRDGDLALVVAAHGRNELQTLRQGLEAGLPYVGLVASGRRGDGILGELRGDGVSEELLSRIDVPAGLDIGARTPAEIALSILARIITVGREVARPEAANAATRETADVPAMAPTPPTMAVDPICGMTVAAVAGTPSIEHEGETVYFCCEGCQAAFAARREHAGAE